MGGASSGQVVLDCIRKKAEKAMEFKQCSFIASASVPASSSCFCFHQRWTVKYKPHKAFSHKLAFGLGVYKKKQAKTYIITEKPLMSQRNKRKRRKRRKKESIKQ